jgi:hypothetical protein
MKIYWSIKSIPEFEGMSKSAIRKLWIQSHCKPYYHWQQWVISSIIITYSMFMVSEKVPTNATIILLVVLGAIIFLVWSQISIILARPYIKQTINDSKIT